MKAFPETPASLDYTPWGQGCKAEGWNRIAVGRRLGQHFLCDPEVVERLLRAAAPAPWDRILEIGPGRGVLTLRLAEAAGAVVAVEADRRLAQALPAHPRLRVVAADFLEVDLETLLAPPAGWKVVANLPYCITTPILQRLLPCTRVAGMWLMMQREVARRIASPASRVAGAITYFTAYHARVQVLFEVPPGAFHPPPRVDSAVVYLERHPRPPVEADPERLFRLVRVAFQGRRKTLQRSLRPLLGEAAAEVLERAGIDPRRRAETLSLEEFAALARAHPPA